MANSVLQDPFGIEWPLGFVAVANNGTPVNIMKNVDANNINAPNASPGVPGSGVTRAEYSPTCHKVFFQGYKPAANNAGGMVPNNNNVYVLRALGPGNQNSGGPGNRADTGAIVAVLEPGGFFTLPADETVHGVISPYRYVLDVDTDGEGALVTLIGCVRG